MPIPGRLRIGTALPGILLAATATAQSAPSVEVLQALPGSTLTIRGSTTIGAGWHCTAQNIESRVAVAPPNGDAALIPSVRGVWIRVPVSDLRCQSGAMERAMLRALKADRDTAARVIVGVFEIFEETRPGSPNEAHLAGALRVAGTERNIYLRSEITPLADGSLYVQSIVPMTLSAFTITPPRVLFGAVRARDAITVEVRLHYPPWRRS